MGRRKKEQPNETAFDLNAKNSTPVENKSSEPFAEKPADENAPETSVTPKRYSFAIKDGKVDWDSMREKTRNEFCTLLKSDAKVMALLNPEVGEAGGLVTKKDIESLLDTFAFVERKAYPILLEKKTNGLVKLDPEICNEAFKFTQPTKDELAPVGARLANKHLPESIKKMITGGSEVMQFFGGLYMAIDMQMQTALAMWKMKNADVIAAAQARAAAEEAKNKEEKKEPAPVN